MCEPGKVSGTCLFSPAARTEPPSRTLIVNVLFFTLRIQDSALRTAAVLSLSKLMCVSSQFCETYLPLVFRVFETAKDPVVRSNIVIALGDVAVCFSNMIDENRCVTFYLLLLCFFFSSTST
jgi:hypothetical protein